MIAGGTDGIGFALLTSEIQRSKYSKIFVLGRNFSRVDQLFERRDHKTQQLGQQEITKLPCDITQLDEIGETLQKIEDEHINDFVLTIGTFHRGMIADIMPGVAAENEGSRIQDDVVADHFHLNCISTIHLIRLIVAKLVKGNSQILVCTASLSIVARSPYSLQSATKAALRSFVDTLRIELKGKTRVMNLMPPSVDTKIFAKAGDCRKTDGYPPPSRIANAMQYMLDAPPDICIPEMLIEQHHFDVDFG
jgi:short-subunit dehydrogenase